MDIQTVRHALVSVRGPHTEPSAVTVLLMDANFIMSASDDSTVRIWDAVHYFCVKTIVSKFRSFQAHCVLSIRPGSTRKPHTRHDSAPFGKRIVLCVRWQYSALELPHRKNSQGETLSRLIFITNWITEILDAKTMALFAVPQRIRFRLRGHRRKRCFGRAHSRCYSTLMAGADIYYTI